MSLVDLWRRWFDRGARLRTAHRRRPSERYGRQRLAVQPLEERRLLSVNIVDNSDAIGFATSGDWAPGGGPGVGRNDNLYLTFGEPWQTDTADWTFNLSSPGRYRVSATWFTNVDYPQLFTTAAPFSVIDTTAGVVRGSALVNQQFSPNDFSDAGSTWEDLGEFDIIGSSLVVRLTSTTDNATYVVADAIRVERVGDLSPAAELQVAEASSDVQLDSNVAFGAVELNHSLSKTFTISNVGAQPLELTGPISVPAGYTLTAPPALTTLALGQSTTFSVQLDAMLPGDYAGQISFATNDSDENPFAFNVTGTVLATQILDDGQAGFTVVTSPFWGTSATGVGRDGDFRFALGADSLLQNSARWTFNVTPGAYRVAATWVENPDYWATNALFTVDDGSRERGDARLNQRQAPDDFEDAGSTWEDLGGVFYTSTSTLRVRLWRESADGYVIADAIRIERVGNLPSGPEIEVGETAPSLFRNPGILNNAEVVRAPVNLRSLNNAFGFTIYNVGQQTLQLGNVSLPPGYSLYSPTSIPGELAPGQGVGIILTHSSMLPGPFTGQFSLTTNDPDEGLFSFTLSMPVLPTVVVEEHGFVNDVTSVHANQTGTWQDVVGAGSAGKFRATSDPSAVASTSFHGAPGRYRVSATWDENPIYWASNARYEVRDSGALRGAATLNQRLAPDDLSDRGRWWEEIGEFDILSGSLSVRLFANQADGWVIADAIRFEYVRALPPAQIQVTADGVDLAEISGPLDAGTTELGGSIFQRLRIHNHGVETLQIASISLPPGWYFSPDVRSVGAGHSVELVLQFRPAPPGTYSGQAVIHTNDPDGPFTFDITGTVLPTRIIDDELWVSGYEDGPGFDTWATLSGAGREGDFRYARNVLGTETATWTFTNLPPGQYRVSATWPFGSPFYDAAARFLVFDGNLVGARYLNQQSAPDDFLAFDTWWEEIDLVNVTGESLSVQLRADDPALYSIADSVLIERLGDIPAGPEITVAVDDRAATLGTFDFGTTRLFRPIERTFRIGNSGSAALEIDLNSLTLPAGYTLVAPPEATVPVGGATTFVVRLATDDDGVKTGAITFNTNDPDEPAISLNITGEVLPYWTIDNRNHPSSDYIEGSPFVPASHPLAYQGDTSYAHSSWGRATARWIFDGVEPGTYRIGLTWLDTGDGGPNTIYSASVPVTVMDSTQNEGTVFISQQDGPESFADSFFADGRYWKTAFDAIEITGGRVTVSVAIDGAGEGYLFADGAILYRVPQLLPLGNGRTQEPTARETSLPPSPGVPDEGADGLQAELPDDPALDAHLLATAYWDEEVETAAVLLAADSTRDSLADDLAVSASELTEDGLPYLLLSD
jgi:hypothetical protein